MGNRLSKIYTRKGDKGSTGLSNGTRVSKSHLRIQCIGEIDELNSALGIVKSVDNNPLVTENIERIQHHLFDLGGELSLPGHALITNQHVSYLENLLDELNNELLPLKEFILPGGAQPAAFTHLARSICRRAERSLFALVDSENETENQVSEYVLQYINRLSDLLFVIARFINRREGQYDIFWNSQTNQLPE